MKKFKFLNVLAITSLLFTFLACSSPNSTTKGDDTNSAKGIINGKVVYENAGTNTDLSGINVYLEKLEEENRSAVISDSVLSGRTVTAAYYASTVTASDGSYKFSNLPDGNYTVYAVSKEEAAVRSAAIVDGGTITVEDLKLVLKGSLSGTLKVTGGDAAGSLVGVAGTSYIAFVGTDGKFTISGIPAGDYKLCVMSNGKYQAFDTAYTVNGKTTADAGIISVTIEAESSENTSGGIKYITMNNVKDGIQFRGSILSEGSWNSAHSASIYIKDKNNNISMRQEWTKMGPWQSWQLTYPLVNKGKEYTFAVYALDGDYMIYYDEFTVTAEGGLGEFKIENTEEYQTILTDDKILKKAVKAKYTNNPNINIQQEEIYYQLYSGTHIYEPENYYLGEKTKILDSSDTSWDFLSNNWNVSTLPMQSKEILSGNNLCIWSGTFLKISGFTYNGKTHFEMNDFATKEIPWGGSKSKRLIVYGVSFNDTTWKEAFSSEEFEELLNNYELSNMPGDKARSFSVAEEEYNDNNELVIKTVTTEYAYTQLQDTICSLIEEPRITPTLKTKDGTTKFRFTGWSQTFPCNAYSGSGAYENKDAFILKIYVNFEKIQ